MVSNTIFSINQLNNTFFSRPVLLQQQTTISQCYPLKYYSSSKKLKSMSETKVDLKSTYPDLFLAGMQAVQATKARNDY